MRVLLIGATGFIGSAVLARLKAAGHDVVVFNRTAKKAEKWVAQHGGRSARAGAITAASGRRASAPCGRDTPAAAPPRRRP